ncbi:MAG: DUF308 domain-containing protein [Pseudomonadota bacterium]
MTSARWTLISGIILTLGGFLGILAPLAVSFTATLFVGWIFLFQGGLGLYAAFKDADDRGWQLVMAILGIVLGLSFIINPLGGLLSLTLFVGILLASSGALRLWMAYRGSFGLPRWVLILGGVASFALGVIMMFGLAGSGPAILGLLISLEMVMMGSALVAMGWRGKAAAPQTADREDSVNA